MLIPTGPCPQPRRRAPRRRRLRVPTILVAAPMPKRCSPPTSIRATMNSSPAGGRRRTSSNSGRRRSGPLHQARSGFCAPRRPALVGDQPSRSGRSAVFASHQREYPGKMMAGIAQLQLGGGSTATIARFQRDGLGWIRHLAGFRSLNLGVFGLASSYRDRGMSAYSGCSGPCSPPVRLHRDATSARSAPVISTGSPWPSPAAKPRPWRLPNRPNSTVHRQPYGAATEKGEQK